jgi:hypothetical protein
MARIRECNFGNGQNEITESWSEEDKCDQEREVDVARAIAR